MEVRRRGCGAAVGVLLMRSGKFLCVSLMTMASRGVVWMPPEMPAPGAESRYFWSRPAEIRERAPGPVRGTANSPAGARATRATSFPFFFHASAAPSIVDAKPPPPPHHHRSLPTGCPRRPARHPSRRRTPQHHRCTPPHPVAATPRQLPPTPAVETHSANSARRTRRHQRRTRNNRRR